MFSWLFGGKSPAKRNDKIEIGGVFIPRKWEPRGFLFAGAPGTGKTQTILKILLKARERGERAIVLDAGGDIMAKLFKPGDVILNPLDARSAHWSPFAEMTSAAEAEEIAKRIVPEGTGGEKEWNSYARVLVASVMRRLWDENRRTNRDFIQSMIYDSPATLAQLVAGLPAQRLFEDGAERMLSSILAIASTHVAAFANLQLDAPSEGYFSIREHVHDEKNKSWIWIPYKSSTAATSASLRRALIETTISAALDMEPNDERRAWLVMDELASNGQLSTLPEAAARGRKYGLSLILGMQSISQIVALYGHEGAKSIMACAGTWLILRVPDAETADAMSRTVGERQIVRTVANEGFSDGKKSEGTSEQWSIERAVLPSEIQRLPDLHGFLILPGDYEIASVEIKPISIPATTRAEIPAEPHVFAPRPTTTGESKKEPEQAPAPEEKPRKVRFVGAAD